MSMGVSPLTVRGFFKFLSTQTQLLQQGKKSQLFSSLWAHFDENATHDSINATTTLPLAMKTKEQIYHDIKTDHPDASAFSLKLKQGTGYAKTLMKFYKSGITNVWNNHRQMSQIKSHYKLTDQINNQGNDVDLKIPRFPKLVQEMALSLSMNTIEHKTVNDKNHGNVVRGEIVAVDRNLFNLSRNEFQLINRTSKDFVKLPLFVAVCLVFAETTPLLCYAIPELTPSTCVLPSIVPRMWSSASKEKLAHLSRDLDQDALEDLALKTSDNIPLPQARLLAQSLRLVSKYIPVGLYPESVLRTRLNRHYNYLKVDNYYLSGYSSGNVWNLTEQELIVASLERGLIDNIKQEMTFENDNDRKDYMDQLRLRLIKFIMDFENYNIGYLAINHGKIDTKVVQWRQ